jgi:hypothetical protein
MTDMKSRLRKWVTAAVGICAVTFLGLSAVPSNESAVPGGPFLAIVFLFVLTVGVWALLPQSK